MSFRGSLRSIVSPEDYTSMSVSLVQKEDLIKYHEGGQTTITMICRMVMKV